MSRAETVYRMVPCMNGSKRSWQVQMAARVDAQVWTTFAWVTSIKSAKAMVAHLRRPAIPL